MENFGLYAKLIRLPLFIGMSKEELEQIVAHTKFDFRKTDTGKTIVQQDDRCGQLLLLVDGRLQATSRADDNGYAVTETLRAPFTLQPDRVFGLTQRYTHTLVAQEPCSLITIDKNETLKLTTTSLIFHINFLNLISTTLQKRTHEAWRSYPQTLEHRIARFFADHCLYPAGAKTFKIKMRRLAAELNDSRLNISHALNAMQANGLLTLRRGHIDIPALEKLVGTASSSGGVSK